MKDLTLLKAQIKQPNSEHKLAITEKKARPNHINQHSKSIPNHNRGNR